MGGMGGMGGMGRRKDPPHEQEFSVSLENLYTGCTKKFNVTRHVYDQTGNATPEKKMLEIQVKPGWKAGTKITFPNEGDVYPGREPADMIFILKDKPHAFFTRERNDLIYTQDITLRQSLTGIKLTIPHLSGEQLSVVIADVIHPDYVHVIPNKGMPISSTPGKFGNLLIK
eukprot:TRINITY_DN318_c1_g3_i2.p1 TRINITY_DN318_c1_g3~~TRINITY_DN318_c1_g3_i2.p1  ORF type:complete len:171 (-),score=41.12 TRINITY_DN318_c1_g3_i2:88-600(-)